MKESIFTQTTSHAVLGLSSVNVYWSALKYQILCSTALLFWANQATPSISSLQAQAEGLLGIWYLSGHSFRNLLKVWPPITSPKIDIALPSGSSTARPIWSDQPLNATGVMISVLQIRKTKVQRYQMICPGPHRKSPELNPTFLKREPLLSHYRNLHGSWQVSIAGGKRLVAWSKPAFEFEFQPYHLVTAWL